MTQFDPIIGADQSGLVYRQNDNNGKKALLNHHKGPSAPPYAEAGMIWLDDTATPWQLNIYDGTDWILIGNVDATTNAFSPAGVSAQSITLGTSVAATSGTAIDFTNIPSGTKRISVHLDGVSTNGTSNHVLRLGDAGGVETTGYNGAGGLIRNSSTSLITDYASGFGLRSSNAGNIIYGSFQLSLMEGSSNTWTCIGMFYSASPFIWFSSGVKPLSGELDRIRLTTLGGTNSFDAGTINISYE